MKRPKKPIIIYDSGIGGLTLLHSLLLEEPNFDIVYFADYKGLPFGSKPPVVLRKKLIENLKRLDKLFEPQGIVLACNTATAVGVGVIRRVFPDKFIVGTEPAVMPAITDGKRNILLMATPNTIKYSKLIKQQELNENIKLKTLARADLATLIEQNIDNLDLLKTDLKKILMPYGAKMEALVLGCTHYIFLRPLLREILSTDVKIYDGNAGVVRQILRKATPSKDGKLYVITNDITRKNNLITAWSILKEQGGNLCVV